MPIDSDDHNLCAGEGMNLAINSMSIVYEDYPKNKEYMKIQSSNVVNINMFLCLSFSSSHRNN
jgi:hypothetical protein